jgi:hypothetical protein
LKNVEVSLPLSFGQFLFHSEFITGCAIIIPVKTILFSFLCHQGYISFYSLRNYLKYPTNNTFSGFLSKSIDFMTF